MIINEQAVFRHINTGNAYQVIAIGDLESNCQAMVVYRAMFGNHRVWIRPKSEFEDGRFEYIGRIM